jgi:hypothetical protein
MNLQNFLLVFCVFSVLLTALLDFYKIFVSAKKRHVNIFDEAYKLMRESNAIQSVSVNLTYKSGAVIELKGPPADKSTGFSYSHPEYHSQNELKKGYSPKGYVEQVVQGKKVKIPVADLKIIPPKGESAAVSLKKML